MNSAIECLNVSKSFGKIDAVKNVSLQLEKNKIYGLLGRNGAGKTTLLHLITGQYLKDSGEIKAFGEEAFENDNALENMCFVKDKGIKLVDHKVKTIFEMCRVFYKNWDEEFKNRLVKEFGLNTNKKYKQLSRGMETIVAIIIGLASRAPITIFDEPSLGLDAVGRDKFYNLLLEDYEAYKRTIILSSHLIDEMSNLFEEVIILDKGEVLLKENVDELSEKAYYISGKDEVVQHYVKNKRILHAEAFGSTSIVAVYKELTDEDKILLKGLEVEISKIPMQKLFIYLTENNKELK